MLKKVYALSSKVTTTATEVTSMLAMDSLFARHVTAVSVAADRVLTIASFHKLCQRSPTYFVLNRGKV